MKDIIEKEAEEEEITVQQQDDEHMIQFQKIKLVYEGTRVKEFRLTRKLNNAKARMIITNITLHIEIKTKVIYSFKSEIHRGVGEIVDYSKTLASPPGMFISLEVIQAYLEKCEQKGLDLDNVEVW